MHNVEFKDYYQVLGVARDATADEIKRAYRRLARRHHPDVSPQPDAAARMSELNEANAVLSDPERRAAYDALARGRRDGERFTPPPGWDAGFEFSVGSGAGQPGAPAFGGFEGARYSDFFDHLFGRAAHPAGGGPAAGGRGHDHHARMLLDLEDAWCGATREITLRAPQLDAAGRVLLKERTLSVNIPAGVRPGQMIRLAGQGGVGNHGAAPGDLLLEVALRPHPRYRVQGSSLVADLPLAPWEAALGAVVPLTLPDGATLKLRVPAGAQAGRVLTVPGRGWPGRPPGDLELHLQVLLPSALDPRARALYEQMARELGDFDARRVAAAEAERSA